MAFDEWGEVQPPPPNNPVFPGGRIQGPILSFGADTVPWRVEGGRSSPSSPVDIGRPDAVLLRPRPPPCAGPAGSAPRAGGRGVGSRWPPPGRGLLGGRADTPEAVHRHSTHLSRRPLRVDMQAVG